jgi:dTDP-4-amino-4,6-dideoxygalactose transaminase
MSKLIASSYYPCAPHKPGSNLKIKKAISYIYKYPRGKLNSETTQLLKNPNMYFYSYGRHALYNGLIISNLTENDTVLVPEYICRDLLSSINSLGIKIEFYPVDTRLRPILPQSSTAKALIVVNYFGFPQDLKEIKDFCKKNTIILIEDNAHGFLSKSEEGEILGTRGDLGIFSFRKTFPIYNGAGLILNSQFTKLPKKFSEFSNPSLKFKFRKIFLVLPKFVLPLIIKQITKIIRSIRFLKTGQYIQSSLDISENEMPNITPPIDLLSQLQLFDENIEKIKRRTLYSFLKTELEPLGAKTIFELGKETVPYTYCFVADPKNIDQINNFLSSQNLEIFKWPEIPRKINKNAPDFYKNIWCVRFIW